ncbi:MAG TPA: hypothetical protein VNS09_06810 [Solirubrobacter sp.]|nr:hypothetical protein [Solirubrobacter sp.]
MSAIDRKRALFEQVVRLRRAERAHPEDQDIVAVRSHLERELGDVVSLSLAGELLGVSHTTVRRWIEAGEIPRLVDASGRSGVPVQALLRLHDQVGEERAAGRRSLHVIEPVVADARERASRLDPRALVADVDGASEDRHDRARRRALAYHRALAGGLRRAVVDEARHRIWEWREDGRIDARYADQWEEVLRRPLPEIRDVLSEDSEWASDLRQNSPFAGMLSEAERRKILATVR